MYSQVNDSTERLFATFDRESIAALGVNAFDFVESGCSSLVANLGVARMCAALRLLDTGNDKGLIRSPSLT
jgi:hypothetical protein